MRAIASDAGLAADAVVALAFVDDGEMRRLNATYRGRGGTTDVLSFGQALPPGVKGAAAIPHLCRDPDGGLELGDVVVSAAQAERQARRRGHPLSREVAFLAAHGVLHLLGYEDETSQGYREMVRLGGQAVPGPTSTAPGCSPAGRPASRRGRPRRPAR
jgi:probable rRNA maturation factor